MPDISATPLKQPMDVFTKPQRAIIYAVNDDFHEISDPPPVKCMFNPAEYSIRKTNSFDEQSTTEAKTPKTHFMSVGSQSLDLSLTFDSYEAGTDVNELTRGLWKFMEPKEVNVQNNLKKSVPHQVAFEWGSFRFIACITSLSQSYTLFTHEGVPVRAKVNVGFTQYADIEDYPPTNPTSGGGAVEQTWKVVAGDRLDSIAAEVYRDATQWRRIAERNKISNPLALRPGQVLRIPIG